jgi:D-3-phosphoglycerate dehydrogenase / 2-oxoglutarate reductase
LDGMAERLVTQGCVSNILDYLGGRGQSIKPYVVNPEVLAG